MKKYLLLIIPLFFSKIEKNKAIKTTKGKAKND